ncbi:MAG: sugar porter family MFS transporter, partial [Planctomycetes bacterium]|nr:sugar porter family MFS transporter [Planctomycetota bacterium]
MKVSGFLIRSTIVAALGGLLFGFDTAVISGTVDSLRTVFELSSQTLGFTVASALIGTIIGAIGIGWPTDRFGRRNTLIVLAVFYFVSALGSGLAWNWYSFLIFRFLGGLAVGGASVVSPMYIAEISPARVRGRLVAITQFNIVLGILLAFLSNYIITTLQLGADNWRWMFAVEALPAVAFFFLLFANPFSPRWLVARSRVEQARATLLKLGTDDGGVDEEIQAIQQSVDLEHHGIRERFYCKKYFTPISLAVLIAMFNQLSGINAILYYAPNIFKMAGAATESAMLQSVLVGFTNLVFTMLAMLVIDHFGRRRLMLVGSFGYIISLAAASAAFYKYGTQFPPLGGKVVLGALILFIASHAFGQGAVIWVFISEIFPNRVRARGLALGSFTHWIMAAAISWTFPLF